MVEQYGAEEVEALTLAEVNKLLAVYQDPEKRLLLRILYFTGCRVSEALAMRPKDLEAERRRILVPALKTKKAGNIHKIKRIVVDASTVQLMELYIRAKRLNREKPIFRRDRWWAWDLVKKAGEAIGKEGVHPHTLRHSFATHWANAGGSMTKLQRQLGHTRLSTTTDMYLKFSTEDIREDYDRVIGGDENGTVL